MNLNTGLRLCAVALMVCCLASPVKAKPTDPAEIAFKETFGQAVRKVRQTKTTGDDAEFAQRLLTEAESGKHDPALTVLLYWKAYEFGLRDKRGFIAANQALERFHFPSSVYPQCLK